MKWKGDQLWGVIEILPTPSGLLLWELYSQVRGGVFAVWEAAGLGWVRSARVLVPAWAANVRTSPPPPSAWQHDRSSMSAHCARTVLHSPAATLVTAIEGFHWSQPGT